MFIDCPPSLGVLTVNALAAAREVLVPVQAEYYALEGLAQLLDTIELVRERLNPQLRILGVLITMLDARTRLGREVVNEMRDSPRHARVRDRRAAQRAARRSTQPRRADLTI